MAWQTPKQNWTAADGVTMDDMNRIEGNNQANKDSIASLQQNLTAHKSDNMAHVAYATASGTNTYATTIDGITALAEGLSVKIKFTNANTGVSTLNINGLGAKSIKKGNGNDLSSGNIKAGQICHLVYTGSVFQLLGEGGEYGTAGAAQVLSGYTIGTENGIVQGTMPNNGAQNKTISEPGSVTIPAGYTSGGTVTANYLKSPTLIAGYESVIAAFNSEVTITPTPPTPTKIKEFHCVCGGTYRIGYTVHGYNTQYGQIYVNGVPKGAQNVAGDGSSDEDWESDRGNSYTEDIPVNAGDLIQFYVWDTKGTYRTGINSVYIKVAYSCFGTWTI